VKFQRAITGASLADIMAKRNQKPEVRKAQREQAIRYVDTPPRHEKSTRLCSSTKSRVKMWTQNVQSAFKLMLVSLK
jgi:large subunit ribosomal protein L24e